MNWNKDLTGIHLRIAESDAKRIAVLAGPGTGKTSYGLLRRVARLIQRDGVDPRKVLFLTFTRTAAEDFVRKLTSLGIPEAERIQSGTLHSFCLKLLKQNGVFNITQRHAERILMHYEEDVLLQDIPGDFGNLRGRQKLLLQFVNGWAANPGDYPALPQSSADREFQSHAIEWLKRHRAILIGEVVPITYNFLDSNPSAEVFGSYSHILVDEYQDLNKTEQGIVDLLARDSETICIVGDDDQSIYRFRCAHPQGITDYYSLAEEKLTIENCGRCPEQVLKIANKIKELLPQNAKGPLLCSNPGEGNVEVVQWDTPEDEAQGLAQAIAYDINSGKYEAGEILILVQSQLLGKSIRNHIKNVEIECRSFFKEDPISNAKSKRAFTLLQLFANENDGVSLRYWLGIGATDFRREEYRILDEEAKKRNLTAKEALEALVRDEFSLPGTAILIKKYKELKRILENLQGMSLDGVIDFLFPEGNVSLEDLRSLALEVRQVSLNPGELLENMVKVITQPGIPENPDFVRVMSLHKSKGLTSKAVYIAGLVEGIVPRSLANSPEDFAEQRRLFYVAVTRVQSELIISSFYKVLANQAFQLLLPRSPYVTLNGQRYRKTLTSQFVAELRAELPATQSGSKWLESRLT